MFKVLLLAAESILTFEEIVALYKPYTVLFIATHVSLFVIE
jgi:hypothetical protein